MELIPGWTFERPEIVFTRPVAAHDVIPDIGLFADLSGNIFQNVIILLVPNLADTVTKTNGVCRDLMISVKSDYFQHHLEAEWNIKIKIGDRLITDRTFWKWYRNHQIIIPFSEFYQDSTKITIEASPVTLSKVDGQPVFEVKTFICDKAVAQDWLARRSIWIFSTARSGSTWLARDIFGWRHRSRLVDESGVGRMFAPLDWEPERHYGVENLNIAYETKVNETTINPALLDGRLPPFERTFRDPNKELQIFNKANFSLYHELIRTTVFEQTLNEWGVLDYDKIVFKMPNDSHAADLLMRAFSQSRMLFLIRDGRDVLSSRFKAFSSQALAENTNAGLRRHAIAYYSHYWNFQNDIIRAAYDSYDDQKRLFLKFEDLRRNPAQEIDRILKFADMALSADELTDILADVTLENMPAASRGPDKARNLGGVGGYKNAFSSEEIDLMTAIMRPNLERYGYLD